MRAARSTINANMSMSLSMSCVVACDDLVRGGPARMVGERLRADLS
eukprot:COSAG02_NODE_3020_length_7534_cov_5.062004_3_plen_46_part_00